MNSRWSPESGKYLAHWMKQTNRTRRRVATEMEVSVWQISRFKSGALAPSDLFVGRFALCYGFMNAMSIFLIEQNNEVKSDKHGRPIVKITMSTNNTRIKKGQRKHEVQY